MDSVHKRMWKYKKLAAARTPDFQYSFLFSYPFVNITGCGN